MLFRSLVGGHCIGVDPFYLADCAQRLGQNPEIILAGRRINDGMSAYVAAGIAAALGSRDKRGNADILVLGLTFKENVPDLRNSKVVDMISALTAVGHRVDVCDPIADAAEAREEYRLGIVQEIPRDRRYDCVIAAVPHRDFSRLAVDDIERLLTPDGIVADIKGIWRDLRFADGIARWQL